MSFGKITVVVGGREGVDETVGARGISGGGDGILVGDGRGSGINGVYDGGSLYGVSTSWGVDVDGDDK